MKIHTVFVPGYGNSLGDHWQMQWFKKTPNSHWVEQIDWDSPEKNAWVNGLQNTLANIQEPIIFVAHSLGCLTIAEWAQQHHANILGAYLVAVPDPTAPNFPAAISGFQQLPLNSLPFPSKIIASTNDPYCSKERCEYFAQAWGSELRFMGDHGHINASAGFGAWPEGLNKLQEWIKTL